MLASLLSTELRGLVGHWQLVVVVFFGGVVLGAADEPMVKYEQSGFGVLGSASPFGWDSLPCCTCLITSYRGCIACHIIFLFDTKAHYIPNIKLDFKLCKKKHFFEGMHS